jgi:hypothetical protein
MSKPRSRCSSTIGPCAAAIAAVIIAALPVGLQGYLE